MLLTRSLERPLKSRARHFPETVSSDAFDALDKVAALLKAGRMPPTTSKTIVYGGHERWTQRETTVLPWGEIDRYDWLVAEPD